VVVNGQEGPLYDEVVAGALTVRTDGAVDYYATKDSHFWRVRHLP